MNRAPLIVIALVAGSILVTSTLFAGVFTFQPLAQATVEQEDSTTDYYACGVVARIVHCDPALNEFYSFTVEAEAEKVYAVTKDDGNFVPGALDEGLRFRAYFGEYLNITDTREMNPDVFSVSFWAKKDPEFANYAQIVSHFNAAFNSGWLFDNENATSQSIGFSVLNANGTSFATGGAEIPADAYTHLVGTFDGSAVRLYQDGALVNEVIFSGTYEPNPETPMKVGMSSPRFSSPWSGYIDDLRIYDRAISGQEVSTLYENPSNSTTAGLVGHWAFDGNLDDLSGSGNDAKLIIQTAGMAFAPDGRLFFGEKNTGMIRTMENGTVAPEPFAVVPDLRNDMEQGLLGIAVDPEFEANHYLYAYYTAGNNTMSSNTTDDQPRFNRIVRFTDSNGTGTDMRIITDQIPAHPGGMHAGGAIAFGTDGKLYATVGDAYEPEQSQNMTSLLGKVLRLNKDGSIPEDNPVPGSPIYSIGHRNMFGLAFDDKGNGIVSENGEETYDEVNLLVRGGDYGFPTTQPPDRPPELGNETSIKPIRSYWKTIAPTQITYYNGSQFPELEDTFLIGSYNNGRLYALELAQDNSTGDARITGELKMEFPYAMTSNIIAVAQSPTGDVYYGGYYIYRLKAIDIEGAEPNTVPVAITHEPGYRVSGLEMNTFEKSLSMTVTPTGEQQMSQTEIKIPKMLLDGIVGVTGLDSQEQVVPLNFTLDDSALEYNLVRVSHEGNNVTSIVVEAAKVGVLEE